MQPKRRGTSCYRLIGRVGFSHELARIGVFALITFKRNRKEMDSDEYDHGNDNCQKDPPAQLNAFFKISNTGCHRSMIELARLPPCSALPIAPLPSIPATP